MRDAREPFAVIVVILLVLWAAYWLKTDVLKDGGKSGATVTIVRADA